MADRLLLRGGAVVSMDPDVGKLPKGDILIEGDKIVQIAPNIQADAQVMDVTGDIVIPGFIDTHRHTWECAIRGCAPNATLDDYFVEVLDTFAPLYRPDDVYASNLAGALECINAGITTLLDWSHIDYWNQSKIVIPKDDVRRVRDRYFSSKDGLLTMQLATRGPGFCVDDVVTQEWNMARELGLPITVHVAMGRLAGRFGMIKQLQRLNLLGSDTSYIHCCYFSDEERHLVKDTGGKISIASQIEMQMGHGQPPVGKALRHGLRPSLSIDVVTTAPGDMFTNMRSAFAAERVLVNAAAWEANTTIPEDTLTAHGVLEMATINGAYTVGLEHRTGSLAPGKQADVVVIDGKAPGTAPVIDPVATVVLAADVSNVDTVIIAGKVHKRDGKLIANYARARELAEKSRDYLTETAAKKKLQPVG